MSRLMSVAHTEQAVVERRKTVTRRLGWRFLKVGDRLTLVRKAMGRRPDEPLVRLAEVEITHVGREPLDAITLDDIGREGVPVSAWAPIPHEADCRDCAPTAWAEWFARTMGVGLDTEVTRIEWRYI